MVFGTILVVEDDPAMREGLRDNLEAEGYRVLLAGGVREARRQLREGRPDLILLDLMLPDGDGINLCRTLRDEGLRQPVVMLTARGEEIDKVLGLEVGADDYVVKPFSLRELLARVRAHLRRVGTGRPEPEGFSTIGVAQVDFGRHVLLRDGQPQEMSARELDLLRYLHEHRGQVVSRERLLSEVWEHRADIVTRTVDNFIMRLRRHIEPNPSTPRYLVTVHGRGYKLVEQ